jgi:hypothetical protein
VTYGSSIEGDPKMATKPAPPAWQRHELVTKAIFEALLKQDNAQNLEVKHNQTIKGTVTGVEAAAVARDAQSRLHPRKKEVPRERGRMITGGAGHRTGQGSAA